MVTELTYKLMNEIGLDVDSFGRVIDQDHMNVIMMHGKTLKVSLNGEQVMVGRNDLFFDPINNAKLTKYLFSYYIDKLNELEGIYFNIYYPLFNQDGKGCIEIKNDTTIIRSGYYFNECLRYIDLVFRISGEQIVDLTYFDAKV